MLKAPVETVRNTKAAMKPKTAGGRQGKKAKGKGKAKASHDDSNMDIKPVSQPEELVCEFYIPFVPSLLISTLVLSSCLKIAHLASQMTAQEGTLKESLRILIPYMTQRWKESRETVITKQVPPVSI